MSQTRVEIQSTIEEVPPSLVLSIDTVGASQHNDIFSIIRYYGTDSKMVCCSGAT